LIHFFSFIFFFFSCFDATMLIRSLFKSVRVIIYIVFHPRNFLEDSGDHFVSFFVLDLQSEMLKFEEIVLLKFKKDLQHDCSQA
jgi:hypothetical protein